MLIFLPYVKLFQNVINILPTTEQNKIKMLGKIGSAWFIYKKLHVISTLCKLSGFNIW